MATPPGVIDFRGKCSGGFGVHQDHSEKRAPVLRRGPRFFRFLHVRIKDNLLAVPVPPVSAFRQAHGHGRSNDQGIRHNSSGIPIKASRIASLRGPIGRLGMLVSE